MQRLFILASRSHQAALIERLHALRTAHFVEFHESRTGDFAGFRIGRPLPQGAPSSETLVRVRALLRLLGLEGASTQAVVPVKDLEARLASGLDGIERDVQRAIEAREAVKTSLHEGRDVEAKLAPLAAMPLRLEDYRGYERLHVFVGRADPAFQPEVARLAPDHALVEGEGQMIALFVPRARADAVGALLLQHGFAEVEVPEGEGLPSQRIAEIAAERGAFESRLAKAEAEVAKLAVQHKDLLLAAEEHHSILVEKAEAPLSFATSEYAFVVDCWVPASQVEVVEAAMRDVTRDQVHLQRVAYDAHAHENAHGGADAGHSAHPEASPPVLIPPTKYDNPKPAKRFEWFTDLFSTPRYDEIDPTAIFAVVFPIFFGFMVGDLGLGLVMVLLGWLLATKLPRVEGMKQLGTAILVAGIIAAALGGFVFKDALGIPLGVNGEIEHHAAEAVGAGVALTCHDIYTYAHEATWSCIFRGGEAAVHHEYWADPMVHKVTDVPSMLLISLLAGLVHLLVGLLFGIRNEWHHGGKHLAAKFGYLTLLLGFFPAALALLRGDVFAGYEGDHPHTALAFHLPITAGQAYMVTGIGFLLGAIILGWAEGVGGILEIPSMFGAIMSYLRLGAVAIAKGAMAIAFNSFTLVAALTGGPVALVLGTIGFLFAQVVLLALGLLSGGIQALRLNFVEFFTKFYKGGGTAFKPFGRERVATSLPPSPSTP